MRWGTRAGALRLSGFRGVKFSNEANPPSKTNDDVSVLNLETFSWKSTSVGANSDSLTKQPSCHRGVVFSIADVAVVGALLIRFARTDSRQPALAICCRSSNKHFHLDAPPRHATPRFQSRCWWFRSDQVFI